MELTGKESEMLGYIVGCVLSDAANGQDGYVNEAPCGERDARLRDLNGIYGLWADSQDKTKTRKGVEVVLYPAKPCRLDLSESEVKTACGLAERCLAEAEGMPYLMEDADVIRSITEKLRAEAADEKDLFEWYLAKDDFDRHREAPQGEDLLLGDVIIKRNGAYIADVYYEDHRRQKRFSLEICRMDSAENHGEWLGSVRGIWSAENADTFRKRAEKLITAFLDTVSEDNEEKERTDWLILSRTDEDTGFRYSFSRFSGTEEEVSSYLSEKKEADMKARGDALQSFGCDDATGDGSGWLSTYFEFVDGYVDYYAVPVVPGSEWAIVQYIGGINDYRFCFMPESTESRIRGRIRDVWNTARMSASGKTHMPEPDIVRHGTYMSVETFIPHIGTADIIAFPLVVLDHKQELSIESQAAEAEEAVPQGFAGQN